MRSRRSQGVHHGNEQVEEEVFIVSLECFERLPIVPNVPEAYCAVVELLFPKFSLLDLGLTINVKD